MYPRLALVSVVCALVACAASSVSSGETGPLPATDATEPAPAPTNGFEPSADAAAPPPPSTCAGAAARHSYTGCDFWPTIVPTSVRNDFDFAVVVANGGTEDASITVTGPAGFSATAVVPAGGLETVYLPWVAALRGPQANECGLAETLTASVLERKGAFHLTSTIPVTVYQFSTIEFEGKGGPPGKSWAGCGLEVCNIPGSPTYGQRIGCFSYSNDASLLLPSTAFTGTYRVPGKPGVTAPAPLKPLNTYFAVTATADDTLVDVTLPEGETALPGPNVPGGRTFSMTLGRGDVAVVVSPAGETSDLGGSLVRATRPVQVIAGAPCAVGGPMSGGPSCDHIEESVLPAETLGRRYVVAPPTAWDGRVVGHELRFFGNVDGTVLTYEPARPEGCPATLAAGQRVTCTSPYDTSTFVVSGTHEFAVTSVLLSGIYQDRGAFPKKGDPSLTMLVAVEQFRKDFVFLAPLDFSQSWVDIVAPVAAKLKLDGLALTSKPSATVSGFAVYREKLGSGRNGAHALEASEPVSVQVVGLAPYASYAYPAGLDLAPIAPPPPK